MKILFLRSRQSLHHSYSDLASLICNQHTISIFDPDAPLAAQFRNIEVVIDPGGAVGTRDMIDAASGAGVKLWQVTTNGLDHVDVGYFIERNLALANCPGPLTAVPLAEHALWLILSFAKNLPYNRTEGWTRTINEELEGKTLGIVGCGASGQALAKRSWSFGLRIIAVDAAAIPQQVLGECHIDRCGGLAEMNQLVAEADYLSLHLPLNANTRHLIDRDRLSQMKPESVLINVARGGLVNEPDLIEALENGVIRGAGLDVFAEEPLPPEHPFLKMSNVITSPHVAGFTTGTWRRRTRAVVENIYRLADGLSPMYQVNPVG